uniref:Reverse transcriptase zinc-binding domain-containing protein n=1 Tax=Oryza sativa subsp. japonica TaxID=39947 RepID=Q7XD39_ORYSJ|nr:hypothetical protein LOC_Os10g35080 [Oryza sativa Japonica Group]
MRWLTSSACGGRHLLHAASGPHVLVVETRHAQHHEKPPRHQSACLSRRRLHHAAHVVRTGVSGSRLPHKRGGSPTSLSYTVASANSARKLRRHRSTKPPSHLSLRPVTIHRYIPTIAKTNVPSLGGNTLAPAGDERLEALVLTGWGEAWNYHQNVRFSVKSMYLALINNGYIERNKIVWKLKMPLKIKIFMWYLLKGVVIFKATYWLRFWAKLQKCKDDGEFMKVVCRKLETTVMQIFANHGWRFTNRLE